MTRLAEKFAVGINPFGALTMFVNTQVSRADRCHECFDDAHE